AGVQLLAVVEDSHRRNDGVERASALVEDLAGHPQAVPDRTEPDLGASIADTGARDVPRAAVQRNDGLSGHARTLADGSCGIHCRILSIEESAFGRWLKDSARR